MDRDWQSLDRGSSRTEEQLVVFRNCGLSVFVFLTYAVLDKERYVSTCSSFIVLVYPNFNAVDYRIDCETDLQQE